MRGTFSLTDEHRMTITEQLGNLDRIIAQDQLSTLFQPIFSLASRRIHGDRKSVV